MKTHRSFFDCSSFAPLWTRESLAQAVAGSFAVLLGASLSTVAHQDGAQMLQPVVNGRTMRLQWNTAGTLEVAPTPQGPWVPADINGQTVSVHERALSDEARFFRVREKNGTISEVGQLIADAPEKPLSVQQASVRTTGDGKSAVLEIRLAPGQALPSGEVNLLLDGSLVSLNDEGKDGDGKAGDGILGGVIPIDTAALEAMNDYT